MNVNQETVELFMGKGAWTEAGFKIEESKVKEDKTALDESKEVKEETEKHICPLCESELKEPISEENWLQHSVEMQDVFESVQETLNESEEGDEDEPEDEDSEDVEDEDLEEEEDSEDEADEE